MSLITLIYTSELTPVFLMDRTLDLNFVDIVGIRVEPLVHYQTLKNDNSQINRGSTIKINHFFITLSQQRVTKVESDPYTDTMKEYLISL